MASSDVRSPPRIGNRPGTDLANSLLNRWMLVAAVSAVVAVDWLTKLAVAQTMGYGASEAVVAGFFNIVHVRNTGIAFSLFADASPWFREFALPALSLIAVAVLAGMLRGLDEMPGRRRLALALVLAGAIGNLSERLLHGYVTDFLDFHVGAYHWPAFNVADSAITVGVAVLILESLQGRDQASRACSAS